jgi:hypothetical protein
MAALEEIVSKAMARFEERLSEGKCVNWPAILACD